VPMAQEFARHFSQDDARVLIVYKLFEAKIVNFDLFKILIHKTSNFASNLNY